MKLLKHSPLRCLCLSMGKIECVWVLMCIYTHFSTFIESIFLSMYIAALIQFFMAISFPSTSSLSHSVRAKSNVVIIFLFLTNPLLQTWSNTMMKEGEKKSVCMENKQNSPHIDSIGSKVLRVVPIDNHHQRYCSISYWSSFDLLCCHSSQHSCHLPLSNEPSSSHLMGRPCLMSVAALVMKLKYLLCW